VGVCIRNTEDTKFNIILIFDIFTSCFNSDSFPKKSDALIAPTPRLAAGNHVYDLTPL
jgi:hypothetical protein